MIKSNFSLKNIYSNYKTLTTIFLRHAYLFLSVGEHFEKGICRKISTNEILPCCIFILFLHENIR